MRRFQDGDDRAGDEIYKAYRGLIAQCVNRFVWPRRVMERGDVEAVAARAFAKALRHYDPERRVRFGSYAYNVMRYELMRFLRDSSDLVRIPAWVQEAATQGDPESKAVVVRLRSPYPLDITEYDNLLGTSNIPSDLEMDATRVITQWSDKERTAACFVLMGLSATDYADVTPYSRQAGHQYYRKVRDRLRRALDAYQEVR